MVEEHLSVGTTLGQLRGHEALILLCVDVADQALLGLEVKRHGIALVGIGTHLEHRRAKLRPCRVKSAHGMHQTGVHGHRNLFALKVHVLVHHMGLAVQVSPLRSAFIDHGVLGTVGDRGVDAVLALAVQRVGIQRVVYQLVVLPDSFLKGVHGEGVDRQHLADRARIGRNLLLQTGGNQLLEADSVCRCRVSDGVFRRRHSIALSERRKAQARHFGHHKNDDEKRQEYERFSSHGCKITNNLPNTTRLSLI